MRLHPLSRAVSAVLRAIAAKKQIDQHTIAKRTGYTDDKVSRLLGTRRTGAQPIGLDDADMIANALDADLMEVIAEAIRDTPDRPKRRPTAAEIFERGF
ncbi:MULTISPECIES: helix-turn-helix domain-containing protein [Mycobacteroides]|uniref:HTH cro/C1-type domain-containing protein n=1 Tax=Mycobacteroides abscessus subsp. massiliense TaxID=1962118 RepID=A0A1U3SV49_9MYCO|nr:MULTISPECIES: hypothetical protein [Mycobacteroides]SKL85444.1 Uncharacterised protein [Mycobacteroides abscessus subsp. massiliense]SKS90274.1 Uncharacterised protein [Mycobacteroides abscessus subsp. massiliense]SKT21070.1 Uncharacterised protein [Mycobacteroides abscessus subsp. massiliense]SKW83778.1 Uncharacterised protein [Mycobacteroides abscessus subsp. massiliense]SLC03415.1 Uncharacterised protein [Mycobacteroides abscessus subsp. massiliense]